MHNETLIRAGLSPTEAAVYETLLHKGVLTAGKLAKETPYKRGLVYKTLDDLERMGLVEKEERDEKPTLFHPEHPVKLQDFARAKEEKLQEAKRALDEALPALSSEYNLSVGKPGVRFFEGPEGVEQTLNDSLNSKTEIYTYADIDAVEKYIKQINARYAKRREKKDLQKKVLLLDSPTARERMENYHREVTDTKFITMNAPPFGSVMEIYDGKIAYITLSKKNMIGVIIEDASIYEMHKYLFEYMWKLTPDMSKKG